MKPWLSVILPVHNGSAYLGATLASAAALSPSGVEFRVYNSGDDGGRARSVTEPFADLLDLVWHDTPQIKPWTAKTNLGVREARADHVVMLHQDDLWLHGHLNAVRMAIDAYPQAVMSIAPSRFVAHDGRLVGPWRLPFAAGLHPGAAMIDALLVQNSIAIPSPVIRRDAWLEAGGMDEALWYTADWDLYLKLARAGPVAVRYEATTAFRIHGGSLTMAGRSDGVAFRKQLEIVLDRHLAQSASPRWRTIEARARASISVNCALAAASAGEPQFVWRAALDLLRLGPSGLVGYLRQSRIIDRVRPRLRLQLAGGL